MTMKKPEPTSVDGNEQMTRRKVLAWLTGFGLFGSAIVAAFSDLIFIKPRATYGQPNRFSIGKPDTFPPGSRIALEQRRVCIVRDGAKMAAISTTCTHLGCTVQYEAQADRIHCACHGGVYNAYTGANVSGPPPRPLKRFNVTVGENAVEVSRA